MALHTLHLASASMFLVALLVRIGKGLVLYDEY